MSNLKEKPSLKDFQEYILETGLELGFGDLNALQRCIMLGEEVGELFKSIRKQENIKVDKDSKVDAIEDELADVFKQVCAVANYFNIDLEKAFRKKEEKNIGRWE